MLAWITYGGPDGVGALGLEGGALFAVLILLLGGSADARKQLCQGSRVPILPQCTAGTRSKCSREKGFTREQARMHKGIGSPPILKLTTHPSRSPLQQAEVVHTANSLTSTDWYDNSPRVRVEQAPSFILGSRMSVGEHVRKVVSEASLPKTPSRKGW
eukprot:scaffold9593_cov146-Isochrysis_galbana.AAC.1